MNFEHSYNKTEKKQTAQNPTASSNPPIPKQQAPVPVQQPNPEKPITEPKVVQAVLIEPTTVEPMGIVSLVLALITLPLSLCCGIFAFPFPVIVIILALISRSKIKKQPTKYNGAGIALAGLIIGCLTLMVSLLFIALNMILVATDSEFLKAFNDEFTNQTSESSSQRA